MNEIIENKDQLVTLAEAASYMRQRLPKTTKLHISSLYRWTRKGVHGRKLEATTAGGKIFTSIEAVDRFMSLPPAEQPSDLKGQKASQPQAEDRRDPAKSSAELREKLEAR